MSLFIPVVFVISIVFMKYIYEFGTYKLLGSANSRDCWIGSLVAHFILLVILGTQGVI